MIIGVPKEIKVQEHRVAAIPSSVADLVKRGHRVVVETGAGADSSYGDELYQKISWICQPENQKYKHTPNVGPLPNSDAGSNGGSNGNVSNPNGINCAGSIDEVRLLVLLAVSLLPLCSSM